MRKSNLIKSILGLIFSAAILTSCKIGEIKLEEHVEGKQACIDAIGAFLNGTLTDPNVTVEYNSNGQHQMTEYVKGTDSYNVITETGNTTYAYIKEGKHYYVYVETVDFGDGPEEIHYYYTDDETKLAYDEDANVYYENSYFDSLVNVRLLEYFPETSGTFVCDYTTITKNGTKSGTLDFVYSNENGSTNYHLTSTNDLVDYMQITTINKGDSSSNRNIELNFTYGGVTIDYPDTDAWDAAQRAEIERIQRNEAALDAYQNFVENLIYGTEQYSVHCGVGNNTELSEYIDHGKELLIYADYRETIYYKEITTEEVEYYYVYTSDTEKYYIKNDDSLYFGNTYKFYETYMSEIYNVDDKADITYTETDKQLDLLVELNGVTLYTLNVKKDYSGRLDEFNLINYSNENVVRYKVIFSYDGVNINEPDLSEYQDRTNLSNN